jgi:hypothetical protein
MFALESLRELSEIWLRSIVHVEYSSGALFKMKIRMSSVKVMVAYKEIRVNGYVDNDKMKTIYLNSVHLLSTFK